MNRLTALFDQSFMITGAARAIPTGAQFGSADGQKPAAEPSMSTQMVIRRAISPCVVCVQ
jgi:hypothetical protein